MLNFAASPVWLAVHMLFMDVIVIIYKDCLDREIYE